MIFNVTYSFDNSSETTTKWPFVALLLVPVTTIFGNILVGLSVFLEPRLQNRFNYFLVSLSVSDLLSAMFVMPVSALRMFRADIANSWPHEVCLAWYSLDVFFTSTTIIHLCTISLDRYMALNNPLHFYKLKRTSSLCIKIAISWFLPFGIACPLFIFSLKIDNSNPENSSFKGCGPNNTIFIITAVIVTFILPLLIMFVSYVMTVLTIKRQTKNLGALSSHKFKQKTPSQSETLQISANSNSLPMSITNLNRKVSDDIGQIISKERVDVLSASIDISKRSLVSCSNLLIASEKHEDPLTETDSQSILKRLSRQLSIPFQKRHFELHRNSSINSEKLRLCANSLMSSRLSVNSRRIAGSDLGLRYIQKSKKAVQVLGIVFVLFVCCYLPFFVIYLTDFLCVTCQHITGAYIQYSEWIGYSASMMNPVVYHIFNPTFRRTFNRLMKGHCYKNSAIQRTGSFLS